MNKVFKAGFRRLSVSPAIAVAIGIGYVVGYQVASTGDGPALLKEVNAA